MNRALLFDKSTSSSITGGIELHSRSGYFILPGRMVCIVVALVTIF